MIVRIQGEGQWEIADAQAKELNRIDDEMTTVIARHDADRFTSLLTQMLDHVRRNGRALAADELRESDLILPPSDATMEEVERLFAEEGLTTGS